MKKKEIIIPEGIYHLSDYQDLEKQFPQGSFILDKTITGCGATTMFLADNVPTILCSARKELMYCKANSPQFKGKVHLFRDVDDYSTKVIDLENRMMDYVNSFYNPFSQEAPKIIVTYDSFKHVAQRLSEDYKLCRFRIVVDEAQTLFTDAGFKGDVEIEFLENLCHSSNIIFLSATPYIENYLDQIDVFRNLPYVELRWPESSLHATNIEKKPYYNQSPKQTAKRIIDGYRRDGFFKVKMVYGQLVYSTEAVFYVNDVGLILSIIKDNKLTSADTNIICAITEDNQKRLQKVGFNIGHSPQEGEPHKTFTFVTKCAFEGVDFYSTCAYTYIFSNISLKNLALDISLDLPQIMGRQRLGSNHFRYDATIYYKTILNFNNETENAFRSQIVQKQNDTNNSIQLYDDCNKDMKDVLARKFRNSQKVEQYTNDYLTVIDDAVNGAPRVVFNFLAMYNEIRAWQIQKSQYLNGCQVMRAIDNASRPITDDPEIERFLSLLNGNFEDNMRNYCDFLCQHPDYKGVLEWLPQIPSSIKVYFNTLGPDVLRSLSYVEANIIKYMESQGQMDAVRKKVTTSFITGRFYSLKEVKAKLQDIYNRFGVVRRAKATDLEPFLPCRQTKRQTADGREKGYLIL